MPDYFQCADCDSQFQGGHVQITPRGDVQGTACPECGGKRMFRMQPNPVQSEGTLRNMVDMPSGKDAGGNPDGTGILAPPSGRAILTGFIGDELECPTCHAHTSEVNCPFCGTFIDPTGIASEQSGVPAELRPQIPGAPLTEGIMGVEHTDPFDTGNHGRDEYTHGHVLAESINWPINTLQGRCSQCGGDLLEFIDGHTQCDHCGSETPSMHQNIDPVRVPHQQGGPEMHAFNGPEQPSLLQRMFANELSGEGPDPRLDQPGKDVFPVAEPMQSLRCPQCHSEIMIDPHSEGAFCAHCNQQWPIHRDDPLDERSFDTRELAYGLDRPPTVVMPGDWGPVHQGKTAGPMEDALGIESQPRTNLNWTPGMKGRGIVIGGEPHTWNSSDREFRPTQFVSHPDYVESLGVDPKHVDWNTGIEIDPDGKVVATGGHDPAPFIAADPRLKHVEENFFPFGNTMPTTSRTNNMNPYEALWTREADVQFDQGPDQNVLPPTTEPLPRVDNPFPATQADQDQSPPYSIVVQPSELGIHGSHITRKGVLSFLDAHINGTPVRGHGGELVTKYGFRSSPDFGKPLVVAVHDPSHLPAAVESIRHPRGESSLINNLAAKIQRGEATAPPGIDPQTLQPTEGAFLGQGDEPPRVASFIDDLAMGGLAAGGLALAIPTGGADIPEVAAGEAALAGGDAAAGGAAAADTVDAASSTAGGLMSKAMGMGTKGLAAQEGMGIGEKALGLGGGGGGEAAGGGGAGYSGPLQQFTHVLAAFVESDYETPSSVPEIGVKYDDPEDVDQKEFNDQDKSPENPMNPNLQDSGASGEDEVRKDMGKPSQGQFSPDSPAIQRMEMLMPLIEKHYHDGGGANDPMLKGLHEMLEAENPGYLNSADAEAAERFMQNKKQPDHVHATVHEAIMPPMQQGNLNAQQQALDPTGLNPSLQQQAPSSAMPPGGGAQQGHCARCGGVTGPDGACPQCGAAAQAQAQPLPGGPSQIPHPQTFAHTDLLATFVDSANHQGPVTPEQIAAVQQFLIQEGRVDEVPNVPMDPGNPEYAKILAEIQGNPNVPPTVTPEEQTQPPAPQPAAPGGMPVPGMAPGEAGGQPMQPMASFLPDFFSAEEDNDDDGREAICPHCEGKGCTECQFTGRRYPSQSIPHPKAIGTEAKTAADNIAPRCPKCNSGTTGMVGDQDHHAKCHACHNVWKLADLVSDESYGQTSIAKTALHEERQHGGQSNDQANPIGVPAAEQEGQMNQGGDEDSSLTWKDSTGAPLKAGQQYQMVNPSFSIPDLVRVERVKPDGLDVTLLGTYANDPGQQDPNMLTSSTPISKQDMEMQQLSFEPVNQTADDRNNEPPPGSQAPGLAQVPPSGQTTDEHAGSEPEMMAHSSVDPDCPRCGHREFTSSMITAEATEHSCFRCGHDWVTEEKVEKFGSGQGEGWTNPSADWLNEDDNADGLSPRHAGMMQAGQQSRNLGDIAEKDDRLRAVKEYLQGEKTAHTERLAGKNFTRKEQRELIDEDGIARNSDLLSLEGTHYKTSYEEDRVNPERVRDSDMFLGLFN